MKRLFFLIMAATSMLMMASAADVAEIPPYGALHITKIPAIAVDVDITFSQAGASTIHVLGSQLGYTAGAGTIVISASAAAHHFSAAGFNPQLPVIIKIGLLDETGDAFTEPEPVTGSFTMNPNGTTVVDYSAL